MDSEEKAKGAIVNSERKKIKDLCAIPVLCHPDGSRGPENNRKHWIPAFAGMTKSTALQVCTKVPISGER